MKRKWFQRLAALLPLGASDATEAALRKLKDTTPTTYTPKSPRKSSGVRRIGWGPYQISSDE